MSNVSRVSTRMSQYDILSPPQRSETPFTRSDQVAQAWRAANSPVDPPERERRQAATQDGHGSENFSTRSSLPRSQVSRRSGPRRPREIVMPMPLSTSMHAAGMSHARPATAQPEPQQQPYTAPAGPSYAAAPAPPAAGSYAPTTTSYFPAEQSYFEDSTRARARSAIGTWIKTRFNRSFSASSVPNIQIEPPSNPASNSSTGNTMNAVLLTPDDAGHHTLPQHFVPELARALEGVQHADTGAGSVIVLPDGQLPRGFVPLSPILPDLHGVDIDTAPRPFPAPANAAPAPSPQPPAYSPRDIYAPPTTGSGSGSGRARGTSIGSAMLSTSPAPLNRPLSIFSDT
ncbi:hypothetical protein DFH09DRAFT_1476832 [Mycena vulgaris]|nr:hypothetical protein DFH09DRAFT_1476832 [Mycena vulgaris]